MLDRHAERFPRPEQGARLFYDRARAQRDAVRALEDYALRLAVARFVDEEAPARLARLPDRAFASPAEREQIAAIVSKWDEAKRFLKEHDTLADTLG